MRVGDRLASRMPFADGWRDRLWLAGLASGGVALTHVLAYRLAEPDTHSRDQLLLETGHGSWPFVSALAVGALMAGVAQFVLRRLRGAHAVEFSDGRLYRFAAGRLIALQAIGFCGLEALERAVVHERLAAPVLLLGFFVQIAVVALAALVLVLLGRAVEVVARRLRIDRPAERRSPIRAPEPRCWPRPVPARGGPTLRAPPHASLVLTRHLLGGGTRCGLVPRRRSPTGRRCWSASRLSAARGVIAADCDRSRATRFGRTACTRTSFASSRGSRPTRRCVPRP